jgi:hypothetical protein
MTVGVVIVERLFTTGGSDDGGISSHVQAGSIGIQVHDSNDSSMSDSSDSNSGCSVSAIALTEFIEHERIRLNALTKLQ